MVTIGGVESWQSLGWYKCQSWPQDIESTRRTQVRPQDLGGLFTWQRVGQRAS